MKRCSHIIPAFLLFSLTLAPLGEVYATGARTEREVRTEVPTRTVQHLEHRSEPNTTKLGHRNDNDSVGNITQIVDTSLTHSAGTTTYAYDDLYRLTTATITGASSTPYTHTYAYTAIGNIASSSELGTYVYTGDTASDEGTKWANPHAVTGITPLTSTTTGPLTYDKNGNTTASNPHSEYLPSTYVWDYKNRLIEANKPISYGGGNYSYTYTEGSYFDHEGTRVILRTGYDTLSHHPNKYYVLEYNTIPVRPIQARKNIYAGDKLVATVQGTSTEAKVYTNHLDHLGGTRAVSEYDGDTTQVLDYYPFGDSRIADQYAPFDQKKKFTGHELDGETGLYYMGARYYEPKVKRFLSQDPTVLQIGSHTFEDRQGITLKVYLASPQNLSAYAYVLNNPVSYNDPDGRNPVLIVIGGIILYDILLSPNIGYAPDQNEIDRIADPSRSLNGVELSVNALGVLGLVSPSPNDFARVAGIAKKAGGGGGLLNAAQRIAKNYISGKNFESRVKSLFDLGKSKFITVGKNQRLPDGINVDERTISEIKNTEYLEYSSQLRDYATYAKQKGYTFNLYVGAHTKLSKPLEQAAKNGDVTIMRISPE